MVLEDGLLLNLDRDWMLRVMRPKVNGGWNLHQQTVDCDLDHFVLFSSLSSVFGHAGQANYAAANSMLDMLTHHRRANGLPSLTVNWGYLGEVGYLAERQQLGDRLERQGVLSFTVQQALSALEKAIQCGAIQISVMNVDWSRWRGLGVTGKVSSRFTNLLKTVGLSHESRSNRLPTLDVLQAASASDRPELVDRLLRDKLSRVLGVASDRLDRHTPLLDLGLDSLMAVELRNWLEAELAIDLPIVQLMRSPSVSSVTESICTELADSSGQAAVPTAGRSKLDVESNAEQLLAQIDDLSSQQVDELLTTLLDKSSGGLSDAHTDRATEGSS